MCEAGEAGGMLDKVLERLAIFAEADAEIRGRIKSAMMMPIIQLSMAVLGVIFLLVRIFPNFAVMFKKMKMELPAITKTMMWASDMLVENSMMVFASFVGFIIICFFLLKTNTGKIVLAHIAQKAR
jgi:type IV pilus assembly protein PilC